MKKVLLQKNIKLQDDERILLVVRKHWFTHFRDSTKVIITGLSPLVLIPVVAPYVSINPNIPTLFVSVWLLVLWMTVFTVWTNYHLDIWLVTDKRIVSIDQIALFKRDVSTLRVERIQDIKIEKHGFFATFFDFGNLQVQTAGPEENFYVILGIPNPSRVRNIIMQRVDMTTEHKNKIVYNSDQRPSESE